MANAQLLVVYDLRAIGPRNNTRTLRTEHLIRYHQRAV